MALEAAGAEREAGAQASLFYKGRAMALARFPDNPLDGEGSGGWAGLSVVRYIFVAQAKEKDEGAPDDGGVGSEESEEQDKEAVHFDQPSSSDAAQTTDTKQAVVNMAPAAEKGRGHKRARDALFVSFDPNHNGSLCLACDRPSNRKPCRSLAAPPPPVLALMVFGSLRAQ